MFIAEQKFKENIAEYLLYMWQIEDIIRAFGFDLERIEYNLIRENYQDEDEIQTVLNWYDELIRKMKSQNITERGHLSELSEIIYELYYLHNTLLNVTKDKKYIELHQLAEEHLQEFRDRSQYHELNEVELCLNALYSKLLLRLQNRNISEETEFAFNSFRNMIAYLVKRYHMMKNGDFSFQMN